MALLAPNECKTGLRSLRTLYLALTAENRTKRESDVLEIARALTAGMEAAEVGAELSWLETEIQDRRNQLKFECSFCGSTHDLRRDLEALRGRGLTPPYLHLLRKFRYCSAHAYEVVRQLELSGAFREGRGTKS